MFLLSIFSTFHVVASGFCALMGKTLVQMANRTHTEVAVDTHCQTLHSKRGGPHYET